MLGGGAVARDLSRNHLLESSYTNTSDPGVGENINFSDPVRAMHVAWCSNQNAESREEWYGFKPAWQSNHVLREDQVRLKILQRCACGDVPTRSLGSPSIPRVPFLFLGLPPGKTHKSAGETRNTWCRRKETSKICGGRGGAFVLLQKRLCAWGGESVGVKNPQVSFAYGTSHSTVKDRDDGWLCERQELITVGGLENSWSCSIAPWCPALALAVDQKSIQITILGGYVWGRKYVR